ncbi:hypothetical protein [Jiella sp. M17.18]|uniref:tetratricopeptide repeat protein n=1 Tax=Jiella sp. M17.18 TaxID=3234247 RepID=UPI0034DFB8C8
MSLRIFGRYVSVAVLAALSALPSGVLADDGATSPSATLPTPADPSSGSRDARRDRLFEALRSARSEAAARAAESAIWQMWMQAPDTETGRLLAEAMRRRESYDFAGARELLDEAVARAPNYAEAYNQRGFVRFLQDDDDGALEDVDRAIALEPRHFAAMAGRALILMRQGRAELAQQQLRAALAIDPFLKERALLAPSPENPPLAPRPGVDL